MKKNTIQRQCLYCGKAFEATPSTRRKYCSRKCSYQARKKTHNCIDCGKSILLEAVRCRSCAKKGALHPSWGKNVPRKAKVVVRICLVCGKEFIVPCDLGGRVRRRITCSEKCRYKYAGQKMYRRKVIYCAFCGKSLERKPCFLKRNKHHFCDRICQGRWRSKYIIGPDSPRWRGGYEPYYGPNWATQRRKALKRDGHICQQCGKDISGGILHIHHIVPLRKFGHKRYEEANALENLVSLCAHCHGQADNGTPDMGFSN